MSQMTLPSFEVHLSAFLFCPSNRKFAQQPRRSQKKSENLSVLFIHQNLGASLEETACLYKYEQTCPLLRANLCHFPCSPCLRVGGLTTSSRESVCGWRLGLYIKDGIKMIASSSIFSACMKSNAPGLKRGASS